MTQKDLAKEMSVSNQLISKWKTGESVPSLEYLDALCKALKVDYSYFTSDGETEAEQSAAVQTIKTEKQKKFKWNWKLFIIITASVLAAAFIAGFSVLTVFVFVPMANRTNYINDIEKAYENYFALGYYSIIEKSELDGDVKDDYRYDGYFDENGKPVFYDTKSKNTVKDDILTHDGGTSKYHYVHDKTYETVEERTFETFKLKDENGDWKTVYDSRSKEIIAVVNGKLIVSTDYFDGYIAVYDETDLTKPLYYMKKPEDYNSYCEFDELEVLNIGSKTIIAVRINTVDYYGYDLYYF